MPVPPELGTSLGEGRPCSLLPPRGVVPRLTLTACELQPQSPGPRAKGPPQTPASPDRALPPRPGIRTGVPTAQLTRGLSHLRLSAPTAHAQGPLPGGEARRGTRAAGVRGGGGGGRGGGVQRACAERTAAFPMLMRRGAGAGWGRGRSLRRAAEAGAVFPRGRALPAVLAPVPPSLVMDQHRVSAGGRSLPPRGSLASGRAAPGRAGLVGLGAGRGGGGRRACPAAAGCAAGLRRRGCGERGGGCRWKPPRRRAGLFPGVSALARCSARLPEERGGG